MGRLKTALALVGAGLNLVVTTWAASQAEPPARFALLGAGVVMAVALIGLAWRLERRTRQAQPLQKAVAALEEQTRFLQAHNRHLQTQVEVLAAMREVGRVVSDDVDFRRIIEEVFRILEGLIEAREMTVFLRDEKSGQLGPRARRTREGTQFADDIPEAAVALASARQCYQQRQMLRAQKGDQADFLVPLFAAQEILGVVHFIIGLEGSEEERRRRVNECELILNDFTKHISLAIKTPSLHDRAILDSLTGLYTKRHFDEKLQEHLQLARRYQKPLSLILLDLDHFKAVNDTFGHLTGDIVLADVAQIVQENVREVDSCFRYGGEEFAVLLPETDESAAMQTAERLRRMIRGSDFYGEGRVPISLTVSVGVAQVDSPAVTPEELISRADRALYAAKAAGRNATQAWPSTPEEPPGAS